MLKSNRLIVFLVLAVPAFSVGLEASEFKPVALEGVKKSVFGELRNMDNALGAAARELSALPLAGEKAHAVLETLCAQLQYGFDCATVDPSGKMVAVEPNRRHEGEDISRQEHVIALQKTLRPQLSKVFQSVEGLNAVALQRPILDREGKFKGAVSILVNAVQMFAPIVKERLLGVPVAVSVMQTDGRLIFDNDPDQIGRNSFSDPLYERFVDLKKLTREIAAKGSGSGKYTFYRENTDTVVKKEAFWDTVALHGTEWRLILIHTETENPARLQADRDGKALEEAKTALGRLAMNKDLLEALSVSDADAASKLFKEFRRKYPFIYSVQWVDPRGFNRFGYPPENSLTDYDFNSSTMGRDKVFLKVLENRRKMEFKLPLLEGDIAWFYIQPVFKGEEYMGYLYFMVRL